MDPTIWEPDAATNKSLRSRLIFRMQIFTCQYLSLPAKRTVKVHSEKMNDQVGCEGNLESRIG